MRFTVVWQRDAINDLASIWLASADRRGVTAAANCIDRELATNPDQKGQPFFGDRIFIAEPLAVTYAIKEDDRIVDGTASLEPLTFGTKNCYSSINFC